MIKIARDSSLTAALGAGIGYALEAKPLPYALAFGTIMALKSVMHNYLQTTPLKCSKEMRFEAVCLHHFLELGGSVALTSALLHGLGLATITAANAMQAAGALTVLSLTIGLAAKQLHSKTKSSYTMIPYALVLGGSMGVFAAKAFGWNPVAIGTMGAVSEMVENTDDKLFGCIDRRFNREAGRVVRNLTGTVFALSLLKENLLGVAGSVAFTALCAFVTQTSKRQSKTF